MPEEQSEKAMLKDDLEECIKEKMQKVAQGKFLNQYKLM